MTTNDPLVQLSQIATSKFVAKALYAAAYFSVADRIREGITHIDDLARATGTHAPSLYRVLRLLAAHGIFREDEGSRFSLTPAAEPLCSGPDSFRPMVLWIGDPRHDGLYARFTDCVRTGVPSSELGFGLPTFEYLAANPDLSAIFNDAMSSSAKVFHAAAVRAYDFSGIGVLCDVGGGHGALMTAILAQAPWLRGIVFDQPHVVDGARERIEKSGLSSRCEVVAGDFFASVPRADAHIMSFILHDWDDDRARTILGHCHAAQPEDGRVLVLEQLVGPPNVLDFAKTIDIEMLAVTRGKERTEQELKALLADAGYPLARVVRTESPVVVIEGRKR